MIPATDIANRTPEEIEGRIAQTRRALDDKLEKLSDRFDPRVRLKEITGGLAARSPRYLAWSAVGAVAAGLWMAFSGWRRLGQRDLYVSPDHPALDHTYGMTGTSETPF